jgi:hypothetical protein
MKVKNSIDIYRIKRYIIAPYLINVNYNYTQEIKQTSKNYLIQIEN